MEQSTAVNPPCLDRYTYRLNLIDPFGVSRGTRSTMDTVLINLDGGWGEAAPISYYQETVDSVMAKFDYFASLELGDLDLLETVTDMLEPWTKRDQAAKAAFDIALHDRFARKLGIPLWKLFGKAPPAEMVSSFTIGLDEVDVMLQKVEKARSYRTLKIKLGRNLQNDIIVMKEIRRMVGDRTLRVDANGGWTLEQAQKAVPMLADLGVEYVEQPLKKGSIAELRELKKTAPIPIFVDEDCSVSSDIPGLVGAVDGINIKLMKSGGIAEARRMITLARSFGLQVMIGCMIETAVAISAAAHLAPFCDYLDLDGNVLCSNDPFEGVIMDPTGVMSLTDDPGLGVRLRDTVELQPENG